MKARSSASWLVVAVTLLSPVWASAVPAKKCPTVTTTIPHLACTTSYSTLPTCRGTVTVVKHTPLATKCPCTAVYPTKATSTCKASTTTSISVTTTTTTTTAGASACSTTGVPSDPRGTPIPCANVNPTCEADGFTVEYYPNKLGGYSNANGQVHANYYIVEGLSPLDAGTSSITYFPQNTRPGSGGIFPNSSIQTGSDPLSMYPYYPGWTRTTNAGIQVDANNFTLVYSGFFVPPVTGLWQICASADNENDVFLGDGNALNCVAGTTPDSDSALLKAKGASRENPTNCAQVNLVQGLSYPLRSVMGNWQGPSAFDLRMVPPGASPASGTNDWSGYAFPRQCRL